MVLDPFTAIGLAGNIFQFVDYCTGLINSSYEIYNSNDGNSKHNAHVEKIAIRVLELNRSLGAPKLNPVRKYERELQVLREECGQDAQDLLNLIESLRAKKNDKWSSFRQAMRSPWQKDKVSTLEKRLSDHRSTISSYIVEIMRYRSLLCHLDVLMRVLQ